MNYLCCSLTLTPLKVAISLLTLAGMTTMLPAFARPGGPARVQSRKSAAREVVNKLVSEDFEGVRQNFNDEMKRGLSAEKMREVWQAAIQYHGKFKSQGEPNNSQQPGYDVYSIRCEMERSPMEIIVAYDNDGKIGGLWVRPAAA